MGVYRLRVKARRRTARQLLLRELCQHCDKPLKCGQVTYCSRTCQHQGTYKTRQCPTCHRMYDYRPTGIRTKFCSRACFFKSIGQRPAMIAVECAQCDTTFKRSLAAVKRHTRNFCSRPCRDKFYSGSGGSNYRGGQDPNRGRGWVKRAEQIRLRDGYACRRCGKSEIENKQKLSVDHIRPWRSFESKVDANHPDNLVTLCRKCHASKTITIERAWLQGDALGWHQWVQSLNLPSALVN
jgi:hypothetical protein